jgi:hypothetical protein
MFTLLTSDHRDRLVHKIIKFAGHLSKNVSVKCSEHKNFMYDLVRNHEFSVSTLI